MTIANLIDKEIIDGVKLGNYKLLDGFYRDNKQTYLSWAYKYFKISNEESEDIYHDAFEALVRQIILGKLDNLQYTLKSYFFGITKYLILTKFRKKKVSNLENKKLELQMALNGLQTTTPDFDEEDKRLKIIVECIKSLSPGCQSILNLFYNENKSMKEIAVLLNYKNDDVVKAQKMRCTTDLRFCVKSNVDY